MGVQKIKTRQGIRYRFRRTVKKTPLQSRAIYLTRELAEFAEAKTVATFIETGKIITYLPEKTEDKACETVSEVFARWIKWLRLHRSKGYADRLESLMGRAVEQGEEYADLPADELTEAHIEIWGERWSDDLLERGKTRKTVNDWLRYAQTAFNEPWGKRRARPLRDYNPFQYVERYSVQYQAKYVPTKRQINEIKLACSGEYRLYLEVLLETAARVSEGLNLTWADVNCDEAPYSVVLYTRKTADGSRVPRRLKISEELALRFTSWRRRQPAEGKIYIFRQARQEAPHEYIWARSNLVAACNATGHMGFSPGCLRHYRAHRWDANGVPLTKIRDYLGHSKATTTDNYLRSLKAI